MDIIAIITRNPGLILERIMGILLPKSKLCKILRVMSGTNISEYISHRQRLQANLFFNVLFSASIAFVACLNPATRETGDQ
jgi:hypothetical protein